MEIDYAQLLTHAGVWLLSGSLMLIGLAGVIVPLLPGTTLLLLAGGLHAWLLPGTLGSGALWTLVALWAASIVAEFLATVLGTKVFGGSRWGMAGASGGALAGLFWSPLLGVLLGSIGGALLGEWFSGQKAPREVAWSGVGAGVGFVAGTVVKGVFAVMMVAVWLVAALV